MSAPFQPDFIATGDFNSAVVTVAPNTEKARNLFRVEFGCAGVAPISVELTKTRFSDFVVYAEKKGCTVA